MTDEESTDLTEDERALHAPFAGVTAPATVRRFGAVPGRGRLFARTTGAGAGGWRLGPLTAAVALALVVGVAGGAAGLRSHLVNNTGGVAGAAAWPSARTGAVFVGDTSTGTVILFGGRSADGTTLLGDTWSWDGSAWTQLHPAHSPSPRADAVAAYDAATQRVVVFGGTVASAKSGATPSVPPSSACMKSATGACVPPACEGASTVCVTTNQGTCGPVPQPLPATPPKGVPVPGGATGASVSTGGGASVGSGAVSGGSGPANVRSGSASVSVGSGPVTVNPGGPMISSGGPASGGGGSGVGVQHCVVMAPEQSVNDTWTWDGTDWTIQKPAVAPTPQSGTVRMAYDEARGEIVMVGSLVDPGAAAGNVCFGAGSASASGSGSSTGSSASPPAPLKAIPPAVPPCALTANRQVTWTGDGTHWTLHEAGIPAASPVTGPLVYDPAAKAVRTFAQTGCDAYAGGGAGIMALPPTVSKAAGGAGASIALPCIAGQTFAVTAAPGATKASPTVRPPSPSSLVYTWDGTTWQTQTVTTASPGTGAGPCPVLASGVVTSCAMSFGLGSAIMQDSTQALVMLGPSGATYRFDGHGWNALHTATSPKTAAGVMVAWDAADSRTLVFGGNINGAVGTDLWAWDGAAWTNVGGVTPPTPTLVPGPLPLPSGAPGPVCPALPIKAVPPIGAPRVAPSAESNLATKTPASSPPPSPPPRPPVMCALTVVPGTGPGVVIASPRPSGVAEPGVVSGGIAP